MSDERYQTDVDFTGDLDVHSYKLRVTSDAHGGSTGHARDVAVELRRLAGRIEDDVMHAEDQASLQ